MLRRPSRPRSVAARTVLQDLSFDLVYDFRVPVLDVLLHKFLSLEEFRAKLAHELVLVNHLDVVLLLRRFQILALNVEMF